MEQRSLAQRVSLAVQDAIYKVADDLTTVVDEALEAFEDAAEAFEEKVTPMYHYTVNVNGDVSQVVEKVKEEVERQRAQHAPSKTGGSETTLEATLEVVYEYLRERNLLGELSVLSKTNVLNGYRSTLAKTFKTAVYDDITGGRWSAQGHDNTDL